MSEMINNREVLTTEITERQQLLKQILKELHSGVDPDEVKKRYDGKIDKILISELSKMEHELMQEEGISPEEVRRVCSVHTEFFKEAFGFAETKKEKTEPQYQVGHPVHTFFLENKEIANLINNRLKPHTDQFKEKDKKETIESLYTDLTDLLEIDKHYSRKENLLFPYLEKYGINGPSKMMWSIDDFIRGAIKDLKKQLETGQWTKEEVIKSLQFIHDEVLLMIFREENILLPMSIEKLTEDEWIKIANEEHVIGYTFIDPPAKWEPRRADFSEEGIVKDGTIQLETGVLKVEQLELMMNHLPVDITFIDENDVVRYFSHGKERIFHRTKSVIGRTVQNCHPPHSAHIVEALLDDFKSGKKESEDFWIPFKDKYVLIRYFAVRDGEGTYRGTLEFTQNIKPIQEITGEKRLMS
ncbi:DUF438 domain-containing protein [Evansella vedderi]|uniref:DUF438 domain-containing protein n=1 Tax=Evansella vedderi TaxID=38282 RepID=A0ABT9ZZN0_9BACI|nr:DUF438 domain-containing protein [Evansella vedderi]MDQ0256686.1 DUF438 domain-containing protein [Evansella vedderi]